MEARSRLLEWKRRAPHHLPAGADGVKFRFETTRTDLAAEFWSALVAQISTRRRRESRSVEEQSMQVLLEKALASPRPLGFTLVDCSGTGHRIHDVEIGAPAVPPLR